MSSQKDTETKPNAKPAKMRWTIARRIVQVAMLLLFAAPMLIAGWGLLGMYSPSADVASTPSQLPFFGSLSSSQIGPLNIIDPFAGLQMIVAAKSVSLGIVIGMLPPIILYGIIRGRAFCGWVCPVNLLLEGVDWVRKKLNIKVKEAPIPRKAKLIVAIAVLVLSAIVSIPVFEVISPISVINKGIIFGSLVGLITLVAIVFAEVFWGHRVWCRSICPLGGFYQALGKVGVVNVKIDHEACISCNKCKEACLCDPVILDPVIGKDAPESVVKAGDCMACGKCIDACPTGCLKMGIGRK